MKKVILSLAILVATTVSAIAANDNKTPNCPPECKSKTECTEAGVCRRAEKGNKCCKAFEGLNLTPEQQTKIADLRKTMKEEKEKLKAPKCGNKDKDGKCTLTVAQKKQMKAEKKAKKAEARKKYDEGLKSILTPEQYGKYVENLKFAEERKKLAKENLKLDKERKKLDKERKKLDKENQKLAKEIQKLAKEPKKLDKEKQKLAKEIQKLDKEMGR